MGKKGWKQKPYNPRRHLSIDDYVSKWESDEEMAEKLEKEYARSASVPPPRQATAKEEIPAPLPSEILRTKPILKKSNESERRAASAKISWGTYLERTVPSTEGAYSEQAGAIPRNVKPEGACSKATGAIPKNTRPEEVGSRSTGAIPRDPRLRRSHSAEVCILHEEQPSTSRGSTREAAAFPFGHLYVPSRRLPIGPADPPLGACHNCWSPYHRRADCPKEPTRYCKNCGRRDVYIAECERCGPDYVEWKRRDDGRRRMKARKMREGRWERDTSAKRGAYSAPPTRDHLQEARDARIREEPRQSRNYEDDDWDPRDTPLARSLPPLREPVVSTSRLITHPPPATTPPRPTVSREAATAPVASTSRLVPHPPSTATPPSSTDSREAAAAPAPPPPLEWSQHLREVMRDLAHLPVELQMRLLAPVAAEADRRAEEIKKNEEKKR